MQEESYPKSDTRLLKSDLINNWNIFNKKSESDVYNIITAICKEKYEYNPELFDQPVGIQELYDQEYLSQHSLLTTNSWDDFVEAFHKIVFVGINNLFNAGTTVIDSNILEEYLKNEYPSKYLIYAKNSGSLYIDKAIEVAIPENFNTNYNEVRKYSLLRELLKQDIDVSEFFDPEEIDSLVKDKQRDLFERSSLDDIIDYYKGKLFGLSQQYSTRSTRDSVKAGSADAKKQKELWKLKPQVGLEYCSNYLTTVTNGLRKKKFTVMSAGTGTGRFCRVKLMLIDLILLVRN